jgi:hypothetical protein
MRTTRAGRHGSKSAVDVIVDERKHGNSPSRCLRIVEKMNQIKQW